ncbi:MAG: pyruvate ferredoxin oxidoreductase alpha subunit [Cenarchaeum symbiont of Oopsacas minuta]|nr:pyruvate ferredoxin oxidoreductase alpha subunit [Cenarchaeum symbiont of Oopsacas minuta]
MTQELSWMIGGPQGSGVETASNIFSSVCAANGCHIFGKREYHSNIKGEHSYFVIRASEELIRSNVSGVDFLTSYDAETIFRHASSVNKGGIIMYDLKLENVSVSDVPTLDRPSLDMLKERYGRDDIRVRDILESADTAGVNLHPISFHGILDNLAKDLDKPELARMIRLFNVIGVSASFGMLGASSDMVASTTESIFATKPVLAKINASASRHAHAIGESLGNTRIKIPISKHKKSTILVQGYHGTAIGKLVCGCRMQPYYPITPATDESYFLESHQKLGGSKPGSVIVVQTEDEICAAGMTIGSVLTGCRTATCTSGPGFSLMAETLGWAGINEVPMVITLYQRSGPSTGLPTRHGQDDLLCAVHAGHGEFPRLVYASGDVEESFYDTAKCFNYAEHYQLPVIHMMDKYIASSVCTCPRFEPERINIDRGKMLDHVKGDYQRFKLTPDGISPRSSLGMKGGIFWNTGDERDESGHITEDPTMRKKMMEKRMSKYEKLLNELPFKEQAVLHGDKQPVMITSWGSCKGPILDAMHMLKEKGVCVGFVQVKLLWPFPAKIVYSLLEGAKTIINIESNQTSQFGMLLRQQTGIKPNVNIVKYTGRAMTCTELYNTIESIVSGSGKKREVLTYGV